MFLKYCFVIDYITNKIEFLESELSFFKSFTYHPKQESTEKEERKCPNCDGTGWVKRLDKNGLILCPVCRLDERERQWAEQESTENGQETGKPDDAHFQKKTTDTLREGDE